jgi:hypothetical protein
MPSPPSTACSGGSKEDLTLRQEIGTLAEKLNEIAEDIAMRVSKA